MSRIRYVKDRKDTHVVCFCVDSPVFTYKILGQAIKNSDVIEIYAKNINPRESQARIFLLDANIDVEEQKHGWRAFVSRVILKRFQKEFETIEA